MAYKMNIRELVPEEYGNYKIYIDRQAIGQYTARYYVALQDKSSARIIFQGNASFFGSWKYDTKEGVLEKVKKYIDSKGVGQQESALNVGDIFYTSWGYDQTNYEFIVVTGINPSGKTVTCRRATELHVGETGQANIQRPITKPFGDTFRMRVEYYAGKEVKLRGSYPYTHTGLIKDGMRLDTFSKWDRKRDFYETDPQFGH